MSVQEVMKEVMKDELIYQQSKVGGLTISGGEPLSQPHFAKQLFISAKEAGITTAIESTGYVKWGVLEDVIPYIDYFFLDMKAYDDDLHRRLVGVSNELILSNAPKISHLLNKMDKKLTVRIPVIPKNSQFEDFERLLHFIKDELDSSVEVEIMAYHRLGRNKYGDLGKSYELFDLEPFSKEELKPYHDAVHSFGFSFS
jgi:pyruvate formate lyase activating enzyme